MDIENSDKGYPFCHEGKSDTLCVFESAIDVMSYLTLIKLHGINNFKHHLLSMGETSYIPIEKYLDRNPQIKKITLCLDADDEGQFFAQKIKEKFGGDYELKSHIPKGKDFNKELTNYKCNFEQRLKVYDLYGENYELQCN